MYQAAGDTLLRYPPLQFNVGVMHQISVTYVDPHTGVFFCRLFDSERKFNDLMQSLQVASLVPLKGIIQDMPCIARKNDLLYRGRLLDVQPEGYRVTFIDYGNTSFVAETDLFQIPLQHCATPVLAIACKLAGCDEVPLDLIVDTFARYESQQPLIGKVVFKHGQCYELDLIDNGTNLSASLLERASGGRFMSNERRTVGPADVALLTDETVTVTVPLSNKEFFCQLSKYSMKNLLSQQEQLLSRYSQARTPLQNVRNGELCVTQFSEDEGFYRARIIQSDGSRCQVSYIDYGNEEVKPASELFEMDPAFCVLPSQGIHCALSAAFDSLPDSVMEGLIDASLTVRLEKQLPTGAYVVSIPNRPENATLNSQLEKYTRKTAPSAASAPDFAALKFPTGGTSVVECEVVHVEDPGNFFCQPLASQAALHTLMDKIESYCTVTPPISLPGSSRGIVDSPVLAKYSADGGWYRATVTGLVKNSNKVEVFFVDYGNMDQVPLGDLRPVQGEFMALEKQAIPCCLEGLDTPDMGWSKEQICSFEEMMHEGNAKIKLCSYDKAQDLYSVEVTTAKDGVINYSFLFSANRLARTHQQQHDRGAVAAKSSYPPVPRQPNRSSVERALHRSPSTMAFQALDVELNKHLAMRVVYAESPAKFWCQLESREGELETLMKQLQAAYTSLGDTEMSMLNVIENRVCCAQYCEDEQWYRAKVVSASGGKVHVHFVDYGNVEQVEPWKVKELSPEFFEAPALAFQCSVFNVEPKDGAMWSDTAKDIFEDLTMETSVMGIVLEKQKGLHVVELVTASGVPVEDILVAKGVAKLKMAEQLPVKAPIVRKLPFDRSSVNHASNRPAAASNGQTDKQTKSYTVARFVKGDIPEVYVSYTVSPDEFYVQQASSAEELADITELIQNMYSIMGVGVMAIKRPEVGMPCCALYSVDNQWYRGILQGVERGNKVKIYFVDWGNDVLVPLENVKQLDDAFVSLPTQAIKCKLDGASPVGSAWTGQANEFFESITVDKQLLGEVKSAGDTHVMSLVVASGNNEVDVADLLVSEGHAKSRGGGPRPNTAPQAATIGRLDLRLNHDYPVCISWVVNLQEFYCQLVEHEQQIVGLCAQLNDYYQALKLNDKSFENVEPGGYCVSFYPSDGNWYRSVVKETKRTSAKVQYVDYGNSAVIPRSKLKVLDDVFQFQPRYAFQCALRFDTKQVEWDKTIASLFQELTRQELRCIIRSHDGDSCLVDLLDQQGQNVYEMLASGNPRTRHGPKPLMEQSFETDQHPFDQHDRARYSNEGSDRSSRFGGDDRLRGGRGGGRGRGGFEERGGRRGFGGDHNSGDDRSVSSVGSGRFGSSEGRGGRGGGRGGRGGERGGRGGFSSDRGGFSRGRGGRGGFSNDRDGDRGGRRGFRGDRSDSGSQKSFKQDRAPFGKSSELGGQRDDRSDSGSSRGGRSFDRRREGDLGGGRGGGRGGFNDRGRGGESRGGRRGGFGGENSSWGSSDNKQGGGFGSSGFGKPSGASDAVVVDDSWGSAFETPEEKVAPVAAVKEEQVLALSSLPPVDLSAVSGSQCYVSIVHSPQRFFIQLENTEDQITELADRLTTDYSSAEASSRSVGAVKVGQLYCAKYSEDEAWYRAVVESVTGEEIRLLFIDYGNLETVALSGIRQLTESFTSSPPLAIECALDGFRKFSEKDTEEFLAATEGVQVFVVEVKGDSKPLRCVLTDPEDEDKVSLASKLPSWGDQPADQKYPDIEVPSGAFTAYVSHIDSPVYFHIQLHEQEDALNALMEQVVEVVANEASLASPLVGDPCLAQFSEDQTWYRAKIQSISADQATVIFVDYGNKETVKVEELKAIPDSLLSSPPFALECSLDGVSSDIKISDEVITVFETCTLEKELTVSVCDSSSTPFKVDIKEGETSVNIQAMEALSGGAKPKTESPKIQNEPEPEKGEVSTTESKQEDTPITGYPTAPALVGKHQAFVSHVDSLDEVYIQLLSEESARNEMDDNLDRVYGEGSVMELSNPQVGAPCCAKYSEDYVWYRARVTAVHGDQIDVLFVDYGNHDTADPSNVRVLEPSFLDKPPSAYCCKLAALPHKPNEGYKQEVMDQLFELTSDKVLTVEAVSGTEPYEIVITDKDQNVNDVIAAMLTLEVAEKTAEATLPKSESQDSFLSAKDEVASKATEDYALQVGDLVSCYVSHTESPSQFWVHLTSAEEQLGEVTEQLQLCEEQETGVAAEDVKTGLLVAARYTDESWYRACVTSLFEEDVDVFFVDFGNRHTVKVSEIKPLEENLLKPAAFAHECQLSKVRAKDGDWSEEAVTRFTDLVTDKALTVEVKDIRSSENPVRCDAFATASAQQNVYIVKLVDAESMECIGTQLQSCSGVAAFSSPARFSEATSSEADFREALSEVDDEEQGGDSLKVEGVVELQKPATEDDVSEEVPQSLSAEKENSNEDKEEDGATGEGDETPIAAKEEQTDNNEQDLADITEQCGSINLEQDNEKKPDAQQLNDETDVHEENENEEQTNVQEQTNEKEEALDLAKESSGAHSGKEDQEQEEPLNLAMKPAAKTQSADESLEIRLGSLSVEDDVEIQRGDMECSLEGETAAHDVTVAESVTSQRKMSAEGLDDTVLSGTREERPVQLNDTVDSRGMEDVQPDAEPIVQDSRGDTDSQDESVEEIKQEEDIKSEPTSADDASIESAVVSGDAKSDNIADQEQVTKDIPEKENEQDMLRFAPHDVTAGAELAVYVTHVESPSCFYCQLAAAAAQLPLFADKLVDYCNTHPQNVPDNIRVGDAYLVADGSSTYRARVTDVKYDVTVDDVMRKDHTTDEDEEDAAISSLVKTILDAIIRESIGGVVVENSGSDVMEQANDVIGYKESQCSVSVLLVDYGNTKILKRCDVWAIPVEFLEGPLPVLRCSLAGIEPASEGSAPHDWDEASVARMHELCDHAHHEENKPFTAKVVAVGAEGIEVELHDGNVDISTQLLDGGYAQRVSVEFDEKESIDDYLDGIDTEAEIYEEELSFVAEDIVRRAIKHGQEMFLADREIGDKADPGIVITDENNFSAVCMDVRSPTDFTLQIDDGQCMTCTLAGIQPPEGADEWPVETTDAFKELVEDTELSAHVVQSHVTDKRHVYLYDVTDMARVSFNRLLVDRGLARIGNDTGLLEGFGESEEHSFLDVSATKDDSFGNIEGSEHVTCSDGDIFSHHVFEADAVVTLRFVTCTADALLCRLDAGDERYQQLLTELGSSCDREEVAIVEEPQVGQACLVRSLDNSWQRARVEQVLPGRGGLKVFCVDEGESLQVPVVRLLTREHLTLPTQILIVRIDNCPRWSNQNDVYNFLEERFCGDTGYVQLNAYVTSQLEDRSVLATVFTSDGTNVLEALQENQLVKKTVESGSTSDASEPTERSRCWCLAEAAVPGSKSESEPTERSRCWCLGEAAVPDTEVQVVLTHADSPASFYCQRQDPEATRLLDSMQEVYNSQTECPFRIEAKEGDVCVVKADGRWYRGRVTSAYEGVYLVQSLDFGMALTCDDVFPLLSEFASVPAQGLHCTLAGISPENSWSEKSDEILQPYLKSTFLATFRPVQEGSESSLVEVELRCLDSDQTLTEVLSERKLLEHGE